MTVMAIAGTLKLLDLDQFAEDLGSWQFLPSVFVPVVLVGLPVAELALAGTWLIGWQTSTVAWWMAGLLGAMFVVVLYHWLHAAPPKCGCFGLFDRYFDSQQFRVVMAFRSGFLFVVLLAGIALSPKPLPDSDRTPI